MNPIHLFWGILAVPVIFAGVCAVLRTPEDALKTALAGSMLSSVVCVAVSISAIRCGVLATEDLWIRVDALSAYHLLVMSAVVGSSSIYAWIYFTEEIAHGRFDLSLSRRFGALWLGTQASMTLVLISNNLGLQWVGVETTTLLTAFLVCLHATRSALEAMWKYVLICSVGLALAFMGLLLLAAAAPAGAGNFLLWTSLVRNAGTLEPTLVKAGFVFLLVGYGTKVGLVPMHSWLPDAHSQAPSPVSAIFSGFLLNVALYCLIRLIPIAEGATGGIGWSLGLLRMFGLASIVLAAAFILYQKNLKRLLAYSSIEHLGIITLGLGLGRAGAAAALFHMLNHSLGKSLAFFSAGRIGQMSGTHDMDHLTGTVRTSPVWGIGLVGGFLALIGVAPFGVFMSKLMVVKAAAESGEMAVLALFVAGMAAVFVGVIGRAISMAWGESRSMASPARNRPAELIGAGLVFGILGSLLVLGLWMPGEVSRLLQNAALIVSEK